MDDGSQGPGRGRGGPGGPGSGAGQGGQSAWTFSLEEITPEVWPLIGFLVEDEVYGARYVELIQLVSSETFSPETMIPIYEANYQMLAAYLEERDNADAIGALRLATDDLLAHVHERAAAAEEFLLGQSAD